MTNFLKRREHGSVKTEAIASQGPETSDPAFTKKYPALAEFLAAEEWSPGEARERGTVTIFFEQGAFKAAVNNRDSAEVAFVSKGAFLGLLEAIEKGLAADSLDWRSQGAKPGAKRRKG